LLRAQERECAAFAERLSALDEQLGLLKCDRAELERARESLEAQLRAVEAEYKRAKAAASGAQEGSEERDSEAKREALCKGSKEQLEGQLAANGQNTEQADVDIKELSTARDAAAERGRRR